MKSYGRNRREKEKGKAVNESENKLQQVNKERK